MSDPYQEAFEDVVREEMHAQEIIVKSVKIRQAWLTRSIYTSYRQFMDDYAGDKELALRVVSPPHTKPAIWLSCMSDPYQEAFEDVLQKERERRPVWVLGLTTTPGRYGYQYTAMPKVSKELANPSSKPAYE